jgi:hypothetical protein
MNARAVGLGLACFLVLPVLAAAHPDVDAGKQAFLKGEFRPALARLEEAERSPSVTEDDLVDIHWYRGASFHALGKKADADKAFDALLLVRPLFAPNKMETPPDIRAAFKKRVDAYQKVHGITVAAPTLSTATISVTWDGPGAADVASVVVFARAPGDVRYVQADGAVEGKGAAALVKDSALWERVAKAGKLQLAVETRNGHGTPVARGGDAMQPLSLDVTPEQAQAAVEAVKPPPEPVRTDPAPPSQTDGSAKPAEAAPSGGSPVRTILLAAGAVLLGLAVLPLVVGVLSLVGLIGSALLFGITWYQFGQFGADKERASLDQRWYAGQFGSLGFGAALAAGAVLGLALGVPGVAVLVARAFL